MNENPFKAPETQNNPGRFSARTSFIVMLLCVATLHGIVTRTIVDRVYFYALYLHYGFGFVAISILLLKKRRSRAVYTGIFWIVTCLSFSISSYLNTPRWAPNGQMIAYLILAPTLISELMLRVQDWFRRNWSQ